MMQFQCPYCQFINSFAPDTLGEAVACGHCNRIQQAPDDPLTPGIVLGDYVLRKLYRKRMGNSDFEAVQLSLERPVLLKIVNPEQNDNKRFIKEFLRMVRATSQVLHPNLLHTYAAGLEGGCYFVAREPVQGDTLARLGKRDKRMGTNAAINVTTQIADALAYAWRAKQLYHGNLKPDYIVVNEFGHAKLIDLGLAMLDPEPEDDSIKGTPHYLAPERIQGDPLDLRVDIYSLGVIFYECLVGQLPFDGDTQLDVLHAHLMHDVVPPHAINPTISEHVSQVVLTMLARDPANRYPNGAILADDLRLVAKRQPPKFAAERARASMQVAQSAHADFVPDPNEVPDFVDDPDAIDDFVADPTDVDDFVTEAGDPAGSLPPPPPPPARQPVNDRSGSVDALMAQATQDANTTFNVRTDQAREAAAGAAADSAPDAAPAGVAADSEPDSEPDAPPAREPAPEESTPRQVKVARAIPIDPDSPQAQAARAAAAAEAADAEDEGPDPEYEDDLSQKTVVTPKLPRPGDAKKKKSTGLFPKQGGKGSKGKKFKIKTTVVRLPNQRPSDS